VRLFGFESAAGKERRLRRSADESAIHEKVPAPEGPTDENPSFQRDLTCNKTEITDNMIKCHRVFAFSFCNFEG